MHAFYEKAKMKNKRKINLCITFLRLIYPLFSVLFIVTFWAVGLVQYMKDNWNTLLITHVAVFPLICYKHSYSMHMFNTSSPLINCCLLSSWLWLQFCWMGWIFSEAYRSVSVWLQSSDGHICNKLSDISVMGSEQQGSQNKLESAMLHTHG